MKAKFVQSQPGLCIHLGVINGDRQLQIVVIDSMESLLDAQLVTVGPTCVIQPSPFVHAHRFSHKSIVIYPFP